LFLRGTGKGIEIDVPSPPGKRGKRNGEIYGSTALRNVSGAACVHHAPAKHKYTSHPPPAASPLGSAAGRASLPFSLPVGDVGGGRGPAAAEAPADGGRDPPAAARVRCVAARGPGPLQRARDGAPVPRRTTGPERSLPRLPLLAPRRVHHAPLRRRPQHPRRLRRSHRAPLPQRADPPPQGPPALRRLQPPPARLGGVRLPPMGCRHRWLVLPRPRLALPQAHPRHRRRPRPPRALPPRVLPRALPAPMRRILVPRARLHCLPLQVSPPLPSYHPLPAPFLSQSTRDAFSSQC
jgi:hypothetical protein